MSNKNQGISSHDSSPGRRIISCELSTHKKPFEAEFHEDDNNKELQVKSFTIRNSLKDKIICYARNCNRIAITTLVLTAGAKQIPIHVCANCKSKFE